MSSSRPAARLTTIAILLVPILSLGACGSNPGDQELRAILEPFFTAANAESKSAALEKAEEASLSLSMDSLRTARSDSAAERNRKMLHLARALHYEISWGLTDDDLKELASKAEKESNVEEQIDNMFSGELVINDLKVLNDLGPGDALALVELLSQSRLNKNTTLPAGANTTTWAAEDLGRAVHDIKLSRLAKHSPLVKLFIEAEALTLPAKTQAQFRWSGAASIDIELPLLIWSKADIEELQSAANRETTRKYSDALERAKTSLSRK